MGAFPFPPDDGRPQRCRESGHDRAGQVDSTLRYYEAAAERHASSLGAGTVDGAMARFAAAMPAGAAVIDVGCGGGRDSVLLARLGFRVTSVDYSPRMAALCAEATGRPALVWDMRGQDPPGRYRGIWACASLVHLRRLELPPVLSRLWAALEPGGVAYLSLKAGTGEGCDADGRFFCYWEEAALAAAIETLPDREETELYMTDDAERVGLRWLNAFVRRKDINA